MSFFCGDGGPCTVRAMPFAALLDDIQPLLRFYQQHLHHHPHHYPAHLDLCIEDWLGILSHQKVTAVIEGLQ